MIFWFSILLVLNSISGRVSYESDTACDSTRRGLSAGNVGDTSAFPWLGVLRVHLHEETSLKIALTGIVLVKEGYAIANADDVSRVPKRVFQHDSKAMFIPRDEKPWYCQVADYMTHPEYQYETLNTIALIELNLGELRFYPMKPICWSSYSYNTSNLLYAVGFTDEHEFLEKYLYKMQYVNQSLCSEFYKRAGLTEGKITPTHYQCGFAPNNTENCVWDAGMALVSNSSGYWTLIGVGLRGPGCAAPARFIDLLYYYPWIESASNLQEIDDYGYRKRGQGRRKHPAEIEDIPLHEVARSGSAPASNNKHDFAHYYSPPKPFTIERVNRTEVVIRNNKVSVAGEACDSSKELVYNDYIDVRAPSPRDALPGYRRRGRVTYKLSLYDLYYWDFKCVKIKIQSKRTEEAYIFYDTEMWGAHASADADTEIEKEITKHYPQHNPYRNLTTPSARRGFNDDGSIPNINIYLKIYFEDEGRLEIKIFGRRTEPSTTTSTVAPPTTVSSVAPTTRTDSPTTSATSPVTPTTSKLTGPSTPWRHFPITRPRRPKNRYLLKNVEVADELFRVSVGTRLRGGFFGFILVVLFYV